MLFIQLRTRGINRQWGRCCIVDLFVSKLLQNFSYTAAPVRVGLNYHLDIFPGDVRKGLNAIYGIGMTSNTPFNSIKILIHRRNGQFMIFSHLKLIRVIKI